MRFSLALKRCVEAEANVLRPRDRGLLWYGELFQRIRLLIMRLPRAVSRQRLFNARSADDGSSVAVVNCFVACTSKRLLWRRAAISVCAVRANLCSRCTAHMEATTAQHRDLDRCLLLTLSVLTWKGACGVAVFICGNVCETRVLVNRIPFSNME